MGATIKRDIVSSALMAVGNISVTAFVSLSNPFVKERSPLIDISASTIANHDCVSILTTTQKYTLGVFAAASSSEWFIIIE